MLPWVVPQFVADSILLLHSHGSVVQAHDLNCRIPGALVGAVAERRSKATIEVGKMLQGCYQSLAAQFAAGAIQSLNQGTRAGQGRPLFPGNLPGRKLWTNQITISSSCLF